MAEKAYFVRHGETDHNAQKLMTGQLDIPLNEKGIAQAREAAGELPNDVSEIFCSDLERCRQTAEILNEGRNLPITYDPRLRERDFGTLAGVSWDEMAEQDPTFWEHERSHQYDYTNHGGEDVGAVRARVHAALSDIREKAIGKPLIVTHGGIVRMMQIDTHGTAENVIKNASITEFDLPKAKK